MILFSALVHTYHFTTLLKSKEWLPATKFPYLSHIFKDVSQSGCETWENFGKWKKRLDILGGRNGIGKDVVMKRGKEGFMEAQTIVAGEGSFPTRLCKDAAFPQAKSHSLGMPSGFHQAMWLCLPLNNKWYVNNKNIKRR